MTAEHSHHSRPVDDDAAEALRELGEFVEAALAQAEQVLRRWAGGDMSEFADCGWCPLCAAVALLRGQRHELVTQVAGRAVNLVVLLRAVLADVPVDPVGAEPTESTSHRRSGRGFGASRPSPPVYQPIAITVTRRATER